MRWATSLCRPNTPTDFIEEPKNKLESLNPAVTVWNGDLCNSFDRMPQMLTTLLNPGKTAWAAHRRRFRFDAPTAKRSWAHVVGGAGCDVPPKGQLTVIDGKVGGDRLRLTMHNLTNDSMLGEYSFKPRRV